jgi:hypothetical protein
MVLSFAVCCYWQCLRTVGGNLLPHTVTPLDVTTLHNAADKLRTFYTLQNACQQHCKHHSDSGQQVSSLPDIDLEVVAVCIPMNCACNIICYSGLAVGQNISDKCVNRYSPSMYMK